MFKPLAVFATFASLLLLLSTSCTRPAGQVTNELTTIAGTDWLLISLQDQQVLQPEGTRTSYISFSDEEKKVKGFAGCNQFSGAYELTDSTLQISRVASTRMICPDMELESTFLKTLESVTAYNISGEILTLYQQKKAIATFRAGGNIRVTQD